MPAHQKILTNLGLSRLANHYLVLSTPQLPQIYSLEGLRQSDAIGFEDPLALAAKFLQDADRVQVAMQQDIALRQQRLTQTRQAKDAIALTAYAGDFDTRQVLAAGFQCHLTKPVEPNELIEAIVELLKEQS